MSVPKLRFKDEQGHEYATLTKGTIADYCYEMKATVDPSSTLDKKFIEYSMPAFDNGKTPTVSLGRDMHSIRKLIEQPCLLINKLNVRKQRIWLHDIEEKDAVCSTEFVALGAKNKCCLAYFEQLSLTNHFTTYLVNNSSGTSNSQKRVSPNTIVKYTSLFPTLPEQEKIADFLSTYDRMIDVQSQRVEAMKTRKKGLLQKIFSQEIRFKDDQGKDYPEWQYHKINEFAKCIAGATPSTKNPEYWDNGIIPWMSSGEVNRRIIKYTDKKISKIGYDHTSTKLLPPNTVVMALAGQGKTRGMVALTKIELCTNQSLCAIVVDDTVKSEYLYQYLLTRYDNLRLISSGDGTRGGLNLKLVGNYIIPVPSLLEQQKIGEFLAAVDTQIDVEEKRLETMKTIKKGLLQQMFI